MIVRFVGALLVLMAMAVIGVVEACPLATDSNGNYLATAHVRFLEIELQDRKGAGAPIIFDDASRFQ